MPCYLLSYGPLCVWLPSLLDALLAYVIRDWICTFIISLLSWCSRLESCAPSLTFCAAPFFVSGYIMGGRRIVAMLDCVDPLFSSDMLWFGWEDIDRLCGKARVTLPLCVRCHLGHQLELIGQHWHVCILSDIFCESGLYGVPTRQGVWVCLLNNVWDRESLDKGWSRIGESCIYAILCIDLRCYFSLSIVYGMVLMLLVKVASQPCGCPDGGLRH